MKRTKIIATFGPAVASQSMLAQLAASGVNLFRINCSHGGTPDFVRASDMIRAATAKNRFAVGLLFDIAGPKLRLDRFEGRLNVKAGQKLTLTTGKTDLDKRAIAVNHPAIITSIRKKGKVYIDDGSIAFEAVSAGRQFVTLRAENPGILIGGKGINLPQTDIKIPTISEKDIEDIKTAVRVKADYVALSFVRSPADIVEARKIIRSYGGQQKIIAKLEKSEAIDNLEKVVQQADGVMIARGDLGVELPFAELPTLQKRIIRLANSHHKPVIVATQMLESMRFSPRATRAEINDVASAVFDLADAVMLSAETATGKYPLETVKTMEQIISATEGCLKPADVPIEGHLVRTDITHAIAGAVSSYETEKLVKIIFAFTTSGFTAGLISNLFPPQLVIALTPNEHVMRRLSIFRSVYAVQIEQPRSFEDMLTTVKEVSRKHNLARAGDKVIITGGVPFGSNVPTNFMMIHEIGRRRSRARRTR